MLPCWLGGLWCGSIVRHVACQKPPHPAVPVAQESLQVIPCLTSGSLPLATPKR